MIYRLLTKIIMGFLGGDLKFSAYYNRCVVNKIVCSTFICVLRGLKGWATPKFVASATPFYREMCSSFCQIKKATFVTFFVILSL